jgi:hypothetical protein
LDWMLEANVLVVKGRGSGPLVVPVMVKASSSPETVPGPMRWSRCFLKSRKRRPKT